jgi:XTP/dITP diphosphohydrolase
MKITKINYMKLLFTSSNKHKTTEIRNQLPDFEILNLIDVGCTEEIPETASTFIGNARLKARHGAENFGVNCFSDDSGLEVLALNNAPGVYSARYAGPERNDESNLQKLLADLKDEESREACFKTAIVLILNGEEHIFEGVVEGSIITEKRGQNGFGYDPIFVPKGHSKTFAEMTLDEKSNLSHRARAVQKMVEFLLSFQKDL